jgi:hypothetical protein
MFTPLLLGLSAEDRDDPDFGKGAAVDGRPPTGVVYVPENEEAAATVDVANAAYGLMIRLIGHAYAQPQSSPEKSLAVDLAIGLMRACTQLGERAARLPAGPSNPDCNAGMSFVVLRDAAPLPAGSSARRFFVERMQELADAAAALDASTDARVATASRSSSAMPSGPPVHEVSAAPDAEVNRRFCPSRIFLHTPTRGAIMMFSAPWKACSESFLILPFRNLAKLTSFSKGNFLRNV